jgi:hypothetical protein
LVRDSLFHFDDVRYRLHAWVVMPNQHPRQSREGRLGESSERLEVESRVGWWGMSVRRAGARRAQGPGWSPASPGPRWSVARPGAGERAEDRCSADAAREAAGGALGWRSPRDDVILEGCRCRPSCVRP